MSMKINPDGTIDVRVVLNVRVHPTDWATEMMGRTDSDLPSQPDLRTDVKRRVRDHVSAVELGGDDYMPILDVKAEGVYP